MRYNEAFADILMELAQLTARRGEMFKSRAYNNAHATVSIFPRDIENPVQLKGQSGIGITIMDKLMEYVDTGKVVAIEMERNNPLHVLSDVHGIGPKKAKDLVDNGITSLNELRKRQVELLNDVQKKGLFYHEQIMQKIPRQEIDEYAKVFTTIFSSVSYGTEDAFEIVGSYRRGRQSSGDIDVIITGRTGDVYEQCINALINAGIIISVLARGASKSLVVARLGSDCIARRVDFLYSPPNEFAFAILYFTGSKYFNTSMRQKAVDMGYTLNEHGLFFLNDKKTRVLSTFKTEQDVFNFLQLEYKQPVERCDGRDVININININKNENNLLPNSPALIMSNENKMQANMEHRVPKKRTLKNRRPTIQTPKDGVKDGQTPEQIIDEFTRYGISVLASLSEDRVADTVLYANKMYHNETAVMTDAQFDIMKKYVEDTYPTNAVNAEIGAEIEYNKVSLPYPMPSMAKIKPDTDALGNWVHKYKGPYVVSCKLDGISALYTTQGTIPALYTRGNGFVGQDISYMIPYLRIPAIDNMVIRGELIIPTHIFNTKYKAQFATVRNTVAGLVRRKTTNNLLHDIHFVAYEVVSPPVKPSEQFIMLKKHSIECTWHQLIGELSNESLSQMLVQHRAAYEYDIDGIVVIDDAVYSKTSSPTPDHAFAFKMVMNDQIAESNVVDVIWSPSKDGYLKPRIRIEEVRIGGVKIEYATGFNASFIKTNGIGVGAVVQLVRSGDVIPYIQHVVVATEPKMPDVPYTWNETGVDAIIAGIGDNDIVQIKNIAQFFKGIEVDGLGEGNVSRIMQSGRRTVGAFLAMSVDDILAIDGFKETMAVKLYNNMQEAATNASISALMSSSNVFGRGFSDKRIELIMDALPDILTSTEPLNQKIVRVSHIKGMAAKTAEQFVAKIGDFIRFLNSCKLEYKLNQASTQTQIQPQNTQHPLYGKSIAITGTRDKTVLDIIRRSGAKVAASVKKTTFMLVAKQLAVDASAALTEAIVLEIPIMQMESFIAKYKPLLD